RNITFQLKFRRNGRTDPDRRRLRGHEVYTAFARWRRAGVDQRPADWSGPTNRFYAQRSAPGRFTLWPAADRRPGWAATDGPVCSPLVRGTRYPYRDSRRRTGAQPDRDTTGDQGPATGDNTWLRRERQQ